MASNLIGTSCFINSLCDFDVGVVCSNFWMLPTFARLEEQICDTPLPIMEKQFEHTFMIGGVIGLRSSFSFLGRPRFPFFL